MVDWPVQAERTHKELLTRFSCADPATEKYEPHRGKWHPRPWQLEVQKQIRTLGLPRPDYERMLLSFHEDGEVGAVFLGRKSGDRPPMFIVNLLAVRADLHRLGVGESMLFCGLVELLEWRDESQLAIDEVYAFIHSCNTPSQALFAKFGFRNTGQHDGSDYDVWRVRLDDLVFPSSPLDDV